MLSKEKRQNQHSKQTTIGKFEEKQRLAEAL